MLTMNLYLSFNGQCEEAFKFYEKCLGGKISFMMKWDDPRMRDHAPPGWDQKIAHATLAVGDCILQGADLPQDRKPAGFSIALGLSDAAEADRIFQSLAEKGTVGMPLQETFWALRFG